MEKKKRDWTKTAALVLCVFLLALSLWQGRQLKDLRQRVESARNTVTERPGLTEQQMPGSLPRPEESPTQPEAAGEAASFAWAECARIDPAARTMVLRIRLEGPGGGDAYSVDVRYGTDGQSGAASLHRLPDGALGGEFTLPLEPDGGVEIARAGGAVLFRRDSLTDLLPVQLAAHPDLLLAEGTAALRECRIELTDPQGGWAEAAGAEYRVDWNGETVFSGACGSIPRGPVELEPWTHPFGEGDTLEYHFLCTDQYGLRYDFILCERPAGEGEDGRCRPVLLWPGE